MFGGVSWLFKWIIWSSLLLVWDDVLKLVWGCVFMVFSGVIWSKNGAGVGHFGGVFRWSLGQEMKKNGRLFGCCERVAARVSLGGEKTK